MLFDANILRDGTVQINYRRGIYWVAYKLLELFLKDKRFEITLYLKTNTKKEALKKIPLLKNLNIIFNYFQIGESFDRKIILNPKFNIKDYDAYFNVDYRTGLEDYSDLKKFYVIHDAIPLAIPDLYSKEINNSFKEFYDKLPEDTFYFCVSNYSKMDFINFFPNIKPENVLVTQISTSQNFTTDYSKEKLNKILDKYKVPKTSRKKYLFNFCGLGDKRKNLNFTIKCFIKFIKKYNINDLYFYFGGCDAALFLENLEKELGSKIFNSYKKYIIVLGYIDDKDINSLLSNSLFFVCLSLYEGFGLPNLEAMQAGTPVISSNTSSIPEVISDCGILINPTDEQECINAYKKLYYNKKTRGYYIKKGLQRAKDFNWNNTYKIISKKIYEVFNG